jgi:hypothetical protein
LTFNQEISTHDQFLKRLGRQGTQGDRFAPKVMEKSSFSKEADLWKLVK